MKDGDGEILLRVRVGTSAAVRGAAAQIKRQPRDKAAIRRLVNALSASSTEDGDIEAIQIKL